MSDLPSQNTIYIQLSTLRDTLDVTIISSSVNKIIITKCTNVVLRFLKALQIRMRWNEKAVMLHFTHAYMQKIAKISNWGMYFLFLSATNKSQPWASKCLHGIWQNYVQRWISLFLHLFTCHVQENHECIRDLWRFSKDCHIQISQACLPRSTWLSETKLMKRVEFQIY